MSNRIVIGILVIIALILAGAGATWLRNSTSSPESSPVAQVDTSVKATASAGEVNTQMSLKELWASANSQKCTFADAESNTSGTVFVSQGKMRGDFSTRSQNQTLNSHMIVDQNTSYVWTEGSTQGMKISIDKITSTAESTQSGQVDINKKTNYHCESWNPDPAVFVLPSEIIFNDFGNLLPQVKASGSATGGAGINLKSACDACDKLSGAAKEQCRSALSCN